MLSISESHNTHKHSEGSENPAVKINKCKLCFSFLSPALGKPLPTLWGSRLTAMRFTDGMGPGDSQVLSKPSRSD